MEQRGFTTTELLVSLAVGGILVSVAVPSFTNFVRNSQQIRAANELVATLHSARDLAITRNVRVTVCPSGSGENCEAVSWDQGWLVFIDPDGDASVDAGEIIERVVVGSADLTVNTADFDEFVIYRPNGRIMVEDIRDNSGEFTICDIRGAQHARVVLIDGSGRPRVSHETLLGGAPVCPS